MYRRKLKSVIKEYFSFTSGERRGILVLFVLIIITVIIRVTLPHFLSAKYVKQPVPKETANVKTHNISPDNLKNENTKHSYPKTFNSKKDYTTNIRIEINSCDSAELQKLPGIGPILSKRIIKYRELLGGYYSKIQILEVFGMTTENFEKCSQQIIVDSLKIEKLKINTATFKEINAHPYITYDQTKALCKFRNKTMKVTIENFNQIEGFDSTQKIKVLPYIKFD